VQLAGRVDGQGTRRKAIEVRSPLGVDTRGARLAVDPGGLKYGSSAQPMSSAMIRTMFG
jgi:hypothetical protein